MPIVQANHIRKSYDTKVAVEGLSLTNSIRIVVGTTQPDSSVRFGNDRPFEWTALPRIGYLPEERGLYKKLKVLGQLVFLGQLHGVDAAEAAKRARTWIVSLIPFCSPLLMNLRISFGSPRPWEIWLSFLLMSLTVAAILWLSSRVYRVGIPMSGKKPNLSAILRWLKYS